jgi:hypothetical protein
MVALFSIQLLCCLYHTLLMGHLATFDVTYPPKTLSEPVFLDDFFGGKWGS